jgi:DNA-binding transcriptional regulator YiaG
MDNPSKKIIDIRNKNNLTRYDLAKKLNVVYGTVKRWELGKAQISQNCFNKLKKLMS